MSFSKILIANRGEIAVRVARTARAMGYRTVAVFSDADVDALHTRVCDEAVRIGPAPVRDSYLSIDALLRAAALSRADAVHPGYGFLSENAAFASACEAAGLVFIGPTPEAIAAMGNKAASKRLMLQAGVPCVPGYHGADQTNVTLAQEAERVGFPLMIKAAAGGGGRGMRIVARSEDLVGHLLTARAEALSAFGSEELILERAILDGRHVEIQVFGDSHGNVLHLGERDCSIQRRHQKVIEESPSPVMTRELRARMGATAVAAAQAISYRGAGTVEFLLEPNGAFYFLEMNTRLQVEHPVTEAVTGLDLVAWQLRVANGERLPLAQAQVRLDGHAIEARLYAEAPSEGFLPQSGRIVAWQPPSGLGLRVDHGLEAPCTVSADYDPMLAKIIARGATREEARRRLKIALEDTVLLGIETNQAFLVDVLDHPEFIAGAATTAFIGQYFAAGSPALVRKVADPQMLALAAVLMTAPDQDRPHLTNSSAGLRGWRSTGAEAGETPLRLETGGRRQTLRIRALGHDLFDVLVPGGPEPDTSVQCRLHEKTADTVRFEIQGLRQSAFFVRDGTSLRVQAGGTAFAFQDVTFDREARAIGDGDARLLAPMNGRIVAVLAQVGDRVVKGQQVAVLEAMKMQHELRARRDGIITEVAVREGDQVATRQFVALLSPT